MFNFRFVRLLVALRRLGLVLLVAALLNRSSHATMREVVT